MIKVVKQKEPIDFDSLVRKKGLVWLENHQNNCDYPDYWRECKAELYNVYQGICAYYAIGIDEITGACTVDHFKPKSKYRTLVYEWDNYRLACSKANSYKGNFEDVMDPFELPENLFHLYFDTGEIYINVTDLEIKKQAQATIDRLKLNDHKMKNRRIKDFILYQKKHISFEELKQQNPFVWVEVIRQNLII